MILALAFAQAAAAEGTNVAFGGLRADTTLPVEVNADSLTVNQADGTAIFSGNVAGDAGRNAADARREIRSNIPPTRRASPAFMPPARSCWSTPPTPPRRIRPIYTIDTGEVVMTGNVLLTQGAGRHVGRKAGDRPEVPAPARMEGRVTTTFVPGKN